MAINAKEQGIRIVTFGVGTDVNTYELQSLASEPYNSTVFSVQASGDLPTLLAPMVQSVCDDVNMCANNPCQNGGSCIRSPQMYQCNCPLPYAGLQCENSCPVQMQVVFVLDLSGSIDEVYNIVIAFAKQVIYGIPVGFGNTRVGVVVFADQPAIMFDLNAYSTVAQVRTALAFRQAFGTTNTQAAITTGYQQVFNSYQGDSTGVKKIMIVVTDGQSNVNQQNTIPAANTVKQQGIEVYTAGVGTEVNKGELDGISSTPASSHEVFIPTSADVNAAAKQLLTLLCAP